MTDNAPREIGALEVGDRRTHVVRVAGPASLVVAKLSKIAERSAGSRQDRILSKDAGDLLRLLRGTDARSLGSRLAELESDEVARGPIRMALDFLRADLVAPRSVLVALAIRASDGAEADRQIDVALRTLGGRVLQGFDDASD